jgi:AcrR family transcriptional regulator
MTDRQEDPIRAQLIKARRAQILDAAAEVFAEKGFARATTKEVASKAGVSEGTIYNYFGSKEDLLIGLMNRLGDVQLRRMHFTSDQLAQALKQDAHDFLRGVLQTRHGFVARSKTMLGAIVAEMLINRELLPYSESLAQHLQARIEQGEIRPMDVSLLLRFFSAVNIGLLVGLLIGDDLLQAQWQDEAFIEALTDFVMYGISVERKPDRDE